MTIRWKTGKKPTEKEVRQVIFNSVHHFNLNRPDVEAIAEAIVKFYEDRVEGKR